MFYLVVSFLHQVYLFSYLCLCFSIYCLLILMIHQLLMIELILFYFILFAEELKRSIKNRLLLYIFLMRIFKYNIYSSEFSYAVILIDKIYLKQVHHLNLLFHIQLGFYVLTLLKF